MQKIIIIFSLSMILLSPTFARTDAELNAVTVSDWNNLLNGDEKHIACSIWIKQYYQQGLFTREIMNDIKKNPEFVFEMMLDLCKESVSASERINIPKNSTIKAERVLYEFFKLAGALKPDLSIWEK